MINQDKIQPGLNSRRSSIRMSMESRCRQLGQGEYGESHGQGTLALHHSLTQHSYVLRALCEIMHYIKTATHSGEYIMPADSMMRMIDNKEQWQL
jgi:hypothetical protein